MSKTRETIGIATKQEVAGSTPSDGVTFEVPYGDSQYTIALSDEEMDRLLDIEYAETLGRLAGRRALTGSALTIELESPDLPLFALPTSIHIEKEAGHSGLVELGVSIVSQSYANEHRGLLLARRHTPRSWEYVRYDLQPPLPDLQAAIEARAAAS